LAATLSASILPLSAIEPVLSSASATRSRDMPHATVEEVPTFTVLMPSTPRKLVFTLPSTEAVRRGPTPVTLL
jgi:hypothetical protein